MNVSYFDFETVGKFSLNDIAYAKGNHGLEAFYRYVPSIENLQKAAEKRKDFPVDRKLLTSIIEKQYKSFTDEESVFQRIAQLENPETYTIITAHQPTLFTGPLYFIYKCLSAINVAERFNKSQSSVKCQPVLILGGEDHDFEEMNHLHLFGKKITWDDHKGGPVGRYTLDTLYPVLDEIYEILGQSENAQILVKKLKSAFTKNVSYGQAMQHFVHLLIGHLGILIINMDEPEFKKLMIPYFVDDIKNSTSQKIVQRVQKSFTDAGFSEQAYVRPINIFYITSDDRDRIEESEGKYLTVNGGKSWTQKELLDEIEQFPERFSPNVILRPIYQEIIFPNLAYVGGGGEISYWLERKEQFDKMKVFYPMLIRRDSFQLISSRDMDTIDEWGFTLEDLMKPEHLIIEKYLALQGRDEIDLSQEIEQLSPLEKAIQDKAKTIDPSLVARIGAQFAKFKNDLNGIEKRLKKVEKQSHETNIKKIKRITDKLYPDNGLQERSDNFMSWYILHGEGFFKELLAKTDPFDTRLKSLVI